VREREREGNREIERDGKREKEKELEERERGRKKERRRESKRKGKPLYVRRHRSITKSEGSGKIIIQLNDPLFVWRLQPLPPPFKFTDLSSGKEC
jgi:hypothetical protein